MFFINEARVMDFNLLITEDSIDKISFLRGQELLSGQIFFLNMHSLNDTLSWNIFMTEASVILSAGIHRENPPETPLDEFSMPAAASSCRMPRKKALGIDSFSVSSCADKVLFERAIVSRVFTA